MANEQGKTSMRALLQQPEMASRLSIAVIALLIVAKAAASVVTGSVGIRADAIHSSIDLLGALVGLLGIRISRRPPDEEHAFGHGKAEAIAGAFIAVLIFGAAGSIIYEAVRRLLEGGSLEYVGLGIYVTAGAIVANVLVAWFALRVARSHESLALEATARDMMADVASSVAVLVGLLLVRITGESAADPIVSLLVAALIARTAYITMRQSVDGLMDTRLPSAEEEYIKRLIRERGVPGFHQLRTRKVGNERHVYLHLIMPKNASVEDAHNVCDDLEKDIERRFQNTDVNIHVEPCSKDCSVCGDACDFREESK